MRKKFKVHIWQEYPRRHPDYFFLSLQKDKRFKVLISYYGKDIAGPKQLIKVNSLLTGQRYVKNDVKSLFKENDWKEYIHIVTGARSFFLIKLIFILIKNHAYWFNWSEKVRQDFKWPIKFLFYRFYGFCINKYALGNFAIGKSAIIQFEKLGVRRKKNYFLPYSYKNLKIDSKKNKLIEKFKNNKKIFMYVGELSKIKATDILISAFGKLNSNNWILVLIGKNKNEIKLKSLIKKFNLENKILIYGQINFKNLANAMKYCDVFILPSRHDGWGAVLNEAASLKKPLIASSQVGAADHCIQNNINGFIVKPNNSNALFKAMKKYVDNEKLLKTHGNNSFKILKKYSVKKNINRMYSAISKLKIK